jgi:hypothetical protein|tara:strand:- start:892 stop:1188 length:297 start_codon:yes stop_codon:yes gene_type:complete
MIPEKIIRQIIPADGWMAVYLMKEPPYYSTWPLAAWALIEGEDSEPPYVMGMDAADYVDFTDSTGDFYIYCHESKITDEIQAEWAEEGRKLIDKEKDA